MTKNYLDITTISIKKETKTEFDKLGNKNESSDTVLRKLIISYNQLEKEREVY